MNKMSIEKYKTYFHDGSIFYIKHENNCMKIAMESAEIDEEDLLPSLKLSKENTIKGILHIDGIIKIQENAKDYTGIYEKKRPIAEIYDLELTPKHVELQIGWETIPINYSYSDFSTLKITAEKVHWENIPNLSVKEEDNYVDLYLDSKGNPISKKSRASRLYPKKPK